MSVKLIQYSLAIFVSFVVIQDCHGAMSRKQMENTGKMMKNTCINKIGVAPEKVQNIKTGEFIDEKEVKCYIACILQMAQIMKSGKLNYDHAKKQIEMMFPDEIKGPVLESLAQCKDSANKIKDVCEGSFVAARCFYNSNPENFWFFP